MKVISTETSRINSCRLFQYNLWLVGATKKCDRKTSTISPWPLDIMLHQTSTFIQLLTIKTFNDAWIVWFTQQTRTSFFSDKADLSAVITVQLLETCVCHGTDDVTVAIWQASHSIRPTLRCCNTSHPIMLTQITISSCLQSRSISTWVQMSSRNPQPTWYIPGHRREIFYSSPKERSFIFVKTLCQLQRLCGFDGRVMRVWKRCSWPILRHYPTIYPQRWIKSMVKTGRTAGLEDEPGIFQRESWSVISTTTFGKIPVKFIGSLIPKTYRLVRTRF